MISLLRATCLFLLLPAIVSAQSATPTASASADKKLIRLSESVRVTLTIEGAAPLRVELPKQLLVPETDRDWKIQPVGTATTKPIGDGREKWVQVFRLDPYVSVDALTVLFAPLKVNGREIPGPGVEVTVEKPSMDIRPDAAMSITGVEEVPASVAPSGSYRFIWGVAAGVLLILIGAAAVWWSRHREKPIPPRDWAAAAFDKLERSRTAGESLANGVAAIVRAFVERKFGVPASKLTTTELLAVAREAGWPVEEADPLRRLLDDCDRAKFAGDIPDDDGCRSLVARGRDWVNLVSPDPGPG